MSAQGGRRDSRVDRAAPPAIALSAEQEQSARGAHGPGVQTLPVGGWDAIGEYGEQTTWLGLLVLEGFVARETSCEQETAIEVIGPGDLLRPWDHDGEIRWRASRHAGDCSSQHGSRSSSAPRVRAQRISPARLGRRYHRTHRPPRALGWQSG